MVERITAKKCSIRDLLDGSYVEKQNDVSYMKTLRGDISRANLIAAVVGKPAHSTLLLDDGTGTIEARTFDDTKLFENVFIGDILLLIGRPREYQGQRYVVAEIAKRLGSLAWLELRKRELSSGNNSNTKITTSPTTEKEKSTRTKIPKPENQTPRKTTELNKIKKEDNILPAPVLTTTGEKVLAVIRELDTGSGAPVEQVIAKLGGGAETILTNLMAEGEIFEIRPGRVKVLE